MRALTIRQPWAHAIAHLGKDVENRTWTPAAAMIGERIAIHAGASWDSSARERFSELGLALPDATPFRVVVAVARIGAVCTEQRSVDGGLPNCCGPWAQPGQMHWRLSDVRPLPRPVEAAGHLSLWKLPGDVETAVLDQIGELP